MFPKHLLVFFLFLGFSSSANASCGTDANKKALAIVQYVLENQGFLIPEERALQLGSFVTGAGGSLVNRNYFSTLLIFTKGSATGFFQCDEDKNLILKMITFGTTEGQIKQKTLSFD